MVSRTKRQGLCPRCPDRAWCARICAELEAELERLSGYQRELLVSAEVLEPLAERSAIPPAAGEETAMADMELSRGRVKGLLTRRQARMVELVFWEGLSLAAAGQRLGISRSAAQRRYRNALARLRQSLAPDS